MSEEVISVLSGYPNYQGIILTNGSLITFGKLYEKLNNKDNQEDFSIWVTNKKSKSKAVKVVGMTKEGVSNKFLQITTTNGDKFYTLRDNQVLTSKGYKQAKDLTLEDILIYCEDKKDTEEKIKVKNISIINYAWEESLYQIELEGGEKNLALLGGVVVHI